MASVQQVAELLTYLGSQDNETRKQAETNYEQARANQPEQLVVSLLQLVGTGDADAAVRKQAAVLVRQLVTRSVDEKKFAFGRCQQSTRNQVASELLRLFSTEQNANMQKKIGEAVAKLAECACDKDENSGWLSNQAGWPSLLPEIFKMANPKSNPNASSCESACAVLKELVGTMPTEIVGNQKDLGGIIEAGFLSGETKLKVEVVLLICKIVLTVKKQEWSPLVQTCSAMIGVLQSTANEGKMEEVEDIIQSFIEVAESEPDFFKQQLQTSMEPANTLSLIIKNNRVENGVRNTALEWIISYIESKTKWVTKHLPALSALGLECCFLFMLEVDSGEDDLKEWANRMDDEEGEEDADELYTFGLEAIDRLVEKCTMSCVSASLFALIAKYAQMDQWQAKLAALGAVKQTVEYVEENEHVDEMARLLLSHVDHPHPRVRYAALHALGQLANDQSDHFQENFHKEVMPKLLMKIDDPVDRVASMAMSAFVSFAEELEKALMVEYQGKFMEKLVMKLQQSKHRMVQEESITSIAVIAGVMEKDASVYYDGMMPLLKNFVLTATGEKQGRLRGKAFECMSLMGLAVGKEKFLPDARDAIMAMVQLKAQAEELTREYINEACQRICKCLKQDFAPFLQILLPGILKVLEYNPAEAEGDDDDIVEIEGADGKTVKVKTSRIEEATESLNLLESFAEEMEGAYHDYVPKTAETILPYITGMNPLAQLSNEARQPAFMTWAHLIKAALEGAKARGADAGASRELLKKYVEEILKVFETENEDAELTGFAADGLAASLSKAGKNVLGLPEVQVLIETLVKLISDSQKRSADMEKSKKEELEPDEEEEDDEDDDEDACRKSCEEAIGSIMEVAPEHFVTCLPKVNDILQAWLSSKQNKILGLHLGCDLLKHLKEQSQPTWPILMPAISKGLTDKDPSVRIAAAYSVNLASETQAFAEMAPQAFTVLAKILTQQAVKKRESEAKMALENAVAALLSLGCNHPNQCPPNVNPFDLVLAKLPIQEDYEEAPKVHNKICDLTMAEHQGLLGANAANLPKILSVLAEVYKSEYFSDEEADTKIKRIFTSIPTDTLRQNVGSFSEKQQKKIERLLTGVE